MLAKTPVLQHDFSNARGLELAKAAAARPAPSRGSARGGTRPGAERSASAPALNLPVSAAGRGGRQHKPARPHVEVANFGNEALLVTGLPVPKGFDDLSERVTNQRLQLYRQQTGVAPVGTPGLPAASDADVV